MLLRMTDERAQLIECLGCAVYDVQVIIHYSHFDPESFFHRECKRRICFCSVTPPRRRVQATNQDIKQILRRSAPQNDP
jgi:hypothetical protein